MSDSILTSIKKQLNISSDYEAFDSDIVLLINSAFATLTQLGVGPEEGFSIQDDTAVWSSFMDDPKLNMVQQYVWMKVRSVFDPPVGSVLSSMDNVIKELEWRLCVAAEEVRLNGSESDDS